MRRGTQTTKSQCKVCIRKLEAGTVCAQCKEAIIGLETWLGRPVELTNRDTTCVGVVIGFRLPDELEVLVKAGVLGTTQMYRVGSVHEHAVCSEGKGCWVQYSCCSDSYIKTFEQKD